MKYVLTVLVCISMLLIAGNVGAASAVLKWTANTEADLAGYKIYRGNGTCAIGPLQPLMVDNSPVVLGKVTTYTDTTVPMFDGDLCYEITSYDLGNNESPRSIRVSTVVNLIPPIPPQNLVIESVIP